MIEGKTALLRTGAALMAVLAIAISEGQGRATQSGKSSPTVSAPVSRPLARPIGNPADWFPRDSYPPEAKAASQEGRTQFSLDIDASGRITSCNIVESSGSELLDSTTCIQLISNGRFTPASDKDGKPVAGVWASAMRWQLSEPVASEE